MPKKSNSIRAIETTERLLPGKPVAGTDPRWQAILKIAHFIKDDPEPIWRFIERWGKHAQTDLRDAVATVLLEHLLENHFIAFFPRVERAAHKSPRFLDTLRRCYWMGEAAWPPNARVLDRLAGMKRPRFRPRKPPRNSDQAVT